jgi:transcriptional regulator with XRE-family HTH domain
MTNKHPHNQHIYACLGQVINLRRKRLKISQEELAEHAGVDRAFISNVERGKRNPSFGIIASIATGLKMRYSRLVAKCEKCVDARQKTG